MKKIGIQRGHLFTKSSQTGTAGEQEAGKLISELIKPELEKYIDVEVVLLNSNLSGVKKKYGAFDLFISLHGDGSLNPNPSGFSIGYVPTQHDSPKFAQILKEEYAKSTGLRFIGYNITAAEKSYYAFKELSYDIAVLLEMGFLTNAHDRNLIMKESHKVVTGIVNAIARQFNLKLKASPVDSSSRPKIVKVYHEDRIIVDSDATIESNGKVYVPVREFAEALGFKVDFHSDGQQVRIDIEKP